ncbi:MAG: FAD-dependent oxidoreductase [Planctomycetes bacterium]|nr:FAD-dependent oxidoreductase [Planctomycetota bacterium]
MPCGYNALPMAELALGIKGFEYRDLFRPERLAALTGEFHRFVRERDPEGGSDLCRASAHLSVFLAKLFRIEEERDASIREHLRESPVMRFRREFVMRRAPALAGDEPGDFAALDREVSALVGEGDRELAVAEYVCRLLDAGPEEPLRLFARWCVAARDVLKWPSLRPPEPIHWPDGLVRSAGPRRRDGFKLTDPRWSLRETLLHTHYCVICHERDKDSCSKGLPLPRKDRPLQKNPLGVSLAGCPLEERISEMHLMKRRGDTLAALALVMIDNPLCPITGHRICNDCMKACLYQKQEPVNIPQIETRTLTDVLNLPWGVEIYGLLTRWNPLDARRPNARPYNGKNVLIVGLGPAGFSLAQHLLNEGFGCVAIDALKIEPLPRELLERPVRDYRELVEALDERVPAGFGGVAEYGITVRWDKNFLKLIRLTLLRREHFRVYGGVRFGGTLTLDDAWSLGFHHVALAAGAGRPTVVEMKNNLLPGMRMASDFLMALQLTGAFKKSSLANLQIRMPVVVIGGGLTGIDAATEALAYYPVQVEKMLERYEAVVRRFGEERVRARFGEAERAMLDEFLEHGRAVRAERARGAPDFRRLLDSWGGVTLCYRKSMQESPAYRLNHEEIAKFLEEGARFAERLEPREAVPDEHGWVKAVRFDRATLPARTVLVAAGNAPNTIYERERPQTFRLDAKGRFFLGFNVRDGKLVPAAQTPEDPGFFTSYEKDGRFVSYYGDNHPVYAGSVVKAVASARDGARDVAALLADEPGGSWNPLVAKLDDALRAVVQKVVRLTPTIVEVVVRAPMQARKFEPGQFYRLHDFETDCPVVDGTKLHMEGIALTGAWVDKERGLLSLVALELGVSSRLCAFLREGEPVVLMGPTGTPSEIGCGEDVVLCGGGLGNAVLFSIGRAMRAAGNRVVYFAGYKNRGDLFHREDIEAACDMAVWSTDAAPPIDPRRPQDRAVVGNIVEAMVAYAQGALGAVLFPLSSARRILAIGSDRMMAAVQAARHGVLAPHLGRDHAALASVNSPMQCMMKEVCAQCLQRHLDPATGREFYVFSCFNQDQPMDSLDWGNLADRLRQNGVQERLSNLWLDLLLEKHAPGPQ